MNYEKDYLPITCYSSRTRAKPEGIVLHHISAVNTHPEDPYNRSFIKDIFVEYSVSAHLLIERDGNVVQLMPMYMQAWHAGKSIMHGKEDCNQFTFGIELVATPDDLFTGAQYAAAQQICQNLMQDFGFDWDSIQGHRMVREAYRKKHGADSATAKYDPNLNFDYDRLRG
jgi:AmpD protein